MVITMYLHVIYPFLAALYLYLLHYPIYHQPFNHDCHSGGSCDSHRTIVTADDHSDHEVYDKENYKTEPDHHFTDSTHSTIKDTPQGSYTAAAKH